MRRRVDAECLTTLGQGRVKIPIDGCINEEKIDVFAYIFLKQWEEMFLTNLHKPSVNA